MRRFDNHIVARLRRELTGDAVYFVGLGGFDFQFAFGSLERVQNELRVDFKLQGVEYTWENGPCAVPAWLLIDQLPREVSLVSATVLQFGFVSGDTIRLHTDESPYECQIFKWSKPDEDGTNIEVY